MLLGSALQVIKQQMGRLFYIMGKSSSGKDTIYRELCSKKELALKTLVMYTTRPIRAGEEQGKEYFFVDESAVQELDRQGKIIEMRAYHTVHGIWKYFTVDDENIDFEQHDYIAIGTLESYRQIRAYYGGRKVIPIYIEVDDGIRLERALLREREPQNGRYEEMCRRFLADAADYAQDKLLEAGIVRKFSNDGDRQKCIEEVAAFIKSQQEERE